MDYSKLKDEICDKYKEDKNISLKPTGIPLV